MHAATDAQLMERYALGDRRAFDELFRRYEGRVYGYFLLRTRSPDAARDLYQDLFLRIHRFRARFDPSQRFESWFFTIARHVYIDHLRRSRGFEELAGDWLANRGQDADAERQAIARTEAHRILAGLSSEQKAVLVAAKVGGFDYAEIAEELGKTVAAVKQAASRTLRRIRALDAGR
ncbi:MAG TPA: RNA polymerase sigma factor [Myxococcota bacterium]